MNNGTPYVGNYERRRQMVQDIVRSRTELDEAAAADLAERILAAIDHIPERIR